MIAEYRAKRKAGKRRDYDLVWRLKINFKKKNNNNNKFLYIYMIIIVCIIN